MPYMHASAQLDSVHAHWSYLLMYLRFGSSNVCTSSRQAEAVLTEADLGPLFVFIAGKRKPLVCRNGERPFVCLSPRSSFEVPS